MYHLFKITTVVFMLLLLGACGGGGGGGSASQGSVSQPYAFEKITVSTAGGEYDLGNSIHLSIPPGAVSQDTIVSLRRVPANEIEGILNSYGKTEKTVLAAVQSSSGISFLEPITLSLPLESTLPPSALPFLMVVDSKNGIYAFDASAPTPITAPSTLKTADSPGGIYASGSSALSLGSLGAKYVKYDCEHNRVIIANITELPEDERELAAVAIKKLRAESDCFDNPCRCCDIRTTEETLDVSRGGEASPGDCYNAAIKGSVQFLSCGDGSLTESYEIVETSVGLVNLRPSELVMQTGSGAMVSVDVLDAKGEEIEFYTIADVPSDNPEVASKGYIEVDQDLFQVLAHKPGQATLNVTLDCSITEPLPVIVLAIPIVTDQDQLVVLEGETSTFQVRLGAPPPPDTTIYLSVSHAGGDTDIFLLDGFDLVFDASNWNVYQQVSLAASEDQDTDNGSTSIALFSESGLLEERTLVAREADNDILQFVMSSGGVSIPEGGTTSLTVRLSNEPTDTVAVSVAHVFGDTDISVESGGALSFGAGDWNTPKAVMLNAAEDDDDIVDGVATIRVSDDAGQLSSVDVRVTEVDNDLLQLIITPGELCIERNHMANLSVIGSTAVDLSQVQWVSSDPKVALVDQTGIVTAQGDGPSLISALYEGADASAVVRVREHCFRVEPSNACLHTPIPELSILPTNLQPLKLRVETAMDGHTVSYVSSNESVVTIDATGTLTAHSGGDALISASVDNVVTDYSYTDVISVHVASSLAEYRTTPVGLPIFKKPPDAGSWLSDIDPYALFLTDERSIYTQSQLVHKTEELAASCGGFPSAPDSYTITDFNNHGEYVGYSGSNTIYFYSSRCVFRELDMNTSQKPKAINDLGMIAIDVIKGNEDPIAIATRDGSVSYTLFGGSALDLNNNGILLHHLRLTDTTWWNDQCTSYYSLLDATTMIADPSNSLIDKLVEPGDCAQPLPMAINNHDIVVGNYLWGEYGDALLGTAAYSTYPDGMFLYYGGEYIDVPVGTWALDVNDSQDILGASSDGAFVAHVCPFTLETNACDWIDNPYRSDAIQGFEQTELSCDGRDNDCDGLVDEGLIPGPTPKQLGVCSGAEMTCKGRDGWVSQYNKIPEYEFPENTCDGKDNDCDGLIDEGIDADGDSHFGVPLCGEVKDCDDTDATVFPGATELCNGRDDNCNGDVDEGC